MWGLLLLCLLLVSSGCALPWAKPDAYDHPYMICGPASSAERPYLICGPVKEILR